jgi:membrane fusion protein, copper/silver efflux system
VKRSIIHIIFIALVSSIVAAGCQKQQQGKEFEANTAHKAPSQEYYTCPMHPSVRSDKPGACPVCHMSLVKVSPEQQREDSLNAGLSVQLSTTEQTLANVATTLVENKALVKEIAAVGKIDLAEPNTKRITARFGGRIEKLFTSFVGQHLRSGEPVAELYSPDAIAAQREFLVAMKTAAADREGSLLLKQSRQKLILLGFTEQQLRDLTNSDTPSTTIVVYSPLAGTVLKKNVEVQQYVSAGETLFDVSDLRSVWLQLDVYERDIAALHLGQVVEAFADDGTSRPLRGSISFISPTLDATTRTARVRAILDNSSGRLKPEMFAHANIMVPLQKTLVVPVTSVVSNGRSEVVWVENEPRHFEPRQVTVGERCGEFYQILSGLLEGELVASRGAYLIDSESQLRQAAPAGAGK